jgi:glycosyltransferase involved in cell wall biosynthesis
MNIAFLTPEYINETEFSGGLANYLHKVTHLLKDAGHRPTVITLASGNSFREDDGVGIREVGKGFFPPLSRFLPPSLEKISGLLNRIIAAKRIARAFWALHKKGSFDIVQVSSYMTPGLTMVHNGRIPVVCRVSSFSSLWRSAFGRPTNLDSVITDYFEIRQAALADSVFAPSEFLAAIYGRMAGISVRLIRSPLFHAMPVMDTAYFASHKPECPYLLYFGTLNRVKGVDLLAEALPFFFRQHPEIDIVFIGKDGGLPNGTSMMDHCSRACGVLSEKLHYFPPMDRSKLYPFVENAIGVLIPSRVDNYPNACLEAQMLGVPVVAAGESSLEEIISEGVNGFLSKNGDAASYLQAMLRCAGMSHEARTAMKSRILAINDTVRAEDRMADLIGYYENVIRHFNKS